MADPNNLTTKKSKNWPRILLVVSLGLNLLIVGLVAGAGLRGGPPGHHRVANRSFAAVGLRGYMPSLTDADRDALRGAIAQNKDQILTTRKAIRKFRRDLAKSLRTQPFDAGVVQSILAAQQRLVTGNIDLGHRLLIERISRMTDSERLQFAERLETNQRRQRRSR